MSSDRDERLKLTAILMLGAIGLFALFPYASGDDLSLDEEATMVAIGAAIGVIIVILSYRLTSLKITRDSMELQLSSMREDLRETVSEVKEAMPEKVLEISAVESTISKSEEKSGDILSEAKEIGQAMKMLRGIMREYKN
jgi:hypothetical protein